MARALLDAVFSGSIKPGTRVPSERQLAESFGVGRFVVREALKSLGLLGLLEVRQGDGTYVRAPDSSLLPRVVEWGMLVGEQRTTDLVETRQHIEPITARLAAQRRSDADLSTIREHLHGMRDASDDSGFVDSDVAFHLSIAAATGNTVLSSMLTSISSLLNVWIRNVVEAADSREPSYREHVPIYDAIEAQKAIAAGEAMRVHMEGAACRLTEAIAAHSRAVQASASRRGIVRRVMRYARVDHLGTPSWVAVSGERLRLLDGAPWNGGVATGTELGWDHVSLLAPVTPATIFCLGRNYAAHRSEMGYGHEGSPSVFMKGPSTIVGPGGDVVLPPRSLSSHVDTRPNSLSSSGRPPASFLLQQFRSHLRIHVRQRRQRPRSAAQRPPAHPRQGFRHLLVPSVRG